MTDVSLNDFGVHHKSLCNVLQCAEDNVCSQEGLRQGDPPTHEREKVKLANYVGKQQVLTKKYI